MLKIGINGRFLLKPYTGMGQYIRNLLKELSKEDSAKIPSAALSENFAEPSRSSEYSYVVVVPEPILTDLFCKNVEIVVLPEKKLGFAGARKTWWEQIQVPEFFKSADVDLAWFPYPSNPWTKDWYKSGVKTVVSVHDCIPWKDRRYRKGLLSKMYNYQSRKAVGKADLVLTVSGESLKDIIKVCSVDKSKIEVVYNDADEVYKETTDKKFAKEVLGRFGLKKDGFVLYVGGYDVRKNVAGLVAQWEKWRKLPLVLAGGKILGDKLYDSFDAAVAGDILKTGFLSGEELSVLYRNCAFFINLSLSEGFNLPILEAANCGAAMILSDIPVHREVAENGAVFVVDDDVLGAMEKLMDLKVRESYREKAKKLAGKYSWKKYAGLVKRHFETLS